MRVGFMASLSRRHLLQLGAGTCLTLLSGCRSGLRPSKLLSAKGTLPKAWLKQLPSAWESTFTQGSEVWPAEGDESVDLVAMGDGWLSTVAPSRLRNMDSPDLKRQMDGQAQRFLTQLGPEQAARVLPVGVSPWVMLFRDGSSWIRAAQEDWNVLLDPALKGRVVLPASPHFVMDLADRIGGDAVLDRLRMQLLTMDDRQATSWLLKGKARVVVLPLQRCMALLRQDPRLTAVLPDAGAPLHWTVMVRPAATRDPIPQSWIQMAWQQPLSRTLLRDGWRSPVALTTARDSLPEPWRDLLHPSDATWDNCWSLPTLDEKDHNVRVERWQASTP